MRGRGGMTLMLLTVGASILLSSAGAVAQESEWAINFKVLRGKAQEADGAGRWWEAVRYYTEVRTIVGCDSVAPFLSS